MSSLAGKRVVNTRAPHQAADLDDLLRENGAEPVPYPCIDIRPPEDTSALDATLREAADGGFDWLLLTSANTVDILARRLAHLELKRVAPPDTRVAAVGPSTARAARERLGLSVDLIPDETLAEGLADSLNVGSDTRILLPQSAIARPALGNTLRAKGVRLTQVDTYRTVMGQGGADVPRMLAAGQIDAITLTSGSTARNFVKRIESEGGSLDSLYDPFENPDGAVIVVIGPRTADEALRAGIPGMVVSEDYTLQGLIEMLEDHFTYGWD